MTDIDTAIGERVHQALWRGRVSQAQAATTLGIDQAAISRRLRGRIAWKASELYDLAELLDIPVTALMPTGEEVRSAIPPQVAKIADVVNTCSRLGVIGMEIKTSAA
jgi:transcriptional regulator with XRE-family HTH domain